MGRSRESGPRRTVVGLVTSCVEGYKGSTSERSGCLLLDIYIYMYSFSRRFYPKRLPRESFTKLGIGH